jgi:hypothetical protein
MIHGDQAAKNTPELTFSSSGFDFRIEGVESIGDLSIVVVERALVGLVSA